jgi:dolichol-phosphate mannosyltransferase
LLGRNQCSASARVPLPDETSSTPELCVVIATWNERLNLPDLTGQLRKSFPESILLIVDDNSPDGTGVWAAEQAERDKGFFFLSRARREGLGKAAIAGLVEALNFKTRWIATMDADFSHPPRDLVRLLERAKAGSPEADVVIGSRYVTGGSIRNWSFRRRLASLLVNWLVRTGLRLPVRDNTSAFRVYRMATLSRILPGPFCSRSHVYLEEILYRLANKGAIIAEVPIEFTDRQKGRSSLSPGSLYQALKELFQLLLFRRRYRE